MKIALTGCLDTAGNVVGVVETCVGPLNKLEKKLVVPADADHSPLFLVELPDRPQAVQVGAAYRLVTLPGRLFLTPCLRLLDAVC